MAEVTTPQAINQSSFGWGDVWDTLESWGGTAVSSWIESRAEPPPQQSNPVQTTGVNTEPVQTATGAVVEPAAPVSIMSNQTFMYALYGFIGLIALLIVLKIFGVL